MRRIRRGVLGHWIAVGAAVAVLSGAPVARAADTWTDIYPGVRLLQRTTTTLRAYGAVVSLCSPGVSVQATRTGDRGRTVPSFGALVGAELAVNGDFFGSGYDPSGMAIGDGVLWPDGADNASEGSLAFGPDRAELVVPSEVVSDPPAWMRQVVSGRPQLVRVGQALSGFTDPSHCPIRRARTGGGLSEDRRTLYLGVVDETGPSQGMTCAEMAVFMRDLGAWDAVNLDGGGSSTIWTAAAGVLNGPSDGSPRVVANHIGVFATGSGLAGHCPDARAEVVLQAKVAGAARSDVDGDGRADACIRGPDGAICALARDDGLTELVAGPAWSDSVGWDGEPYYSTLRMGDIDGDGRADLCARAAAGLLCYPSTGTGFGDAIDGPVLSDATGWDAEQYYSTIVLADFDGDGLDDACARSAAGWFCWPSLGTGFGDAVTGPALSDASGWNDRSNYGTIRMGDLDGDGRADVCARANAGIRCWLSDGAGFPTQLSGPDWDDDSGWNHPRYYTTIALVDVDADGRADLCARTSADYRCHLSLGSGFGDAIVGPALSDADGWGDYDNYSTLRLADIDGDGLLDVCGRANAGLRCWRFLGTAFSTQEVASDALANDDGWDGDSYVRTIRFADVDGDGRADVCGRGAQGLSCWLSLGTAFGDAVAGPAWSDAQGFASPSVYGTLRMGPPRCIAVAERCNGRDDDCDGVVDEDCGGGGAAIGGAAAAGGGAGGDDSPGVQGESDAGGCGCAIPGSARPARGLFALGLPLLLVRHRRRRARLLQSRVAARVRAAG
jgi:hypothetical protein